MPRQPRKLIHPEKGKPKKEGLAVPVRPSLSSHVTEVQRFRCPVCGLMPEAARLENSPYEVRLYLQRFGGRLPGSKVGYMEYLPLDSPSEMVAFQELDLLPVLKQLCALYEKSIMPVAPIALVVPKLRRREKKSIT